VAQPRFYQQESITHAFTASEKDMTWEKVQADPLGILQSFKQETLLSI
jgi:hypothetical protein